MTISSTTVKNSYSGNGSTTAFAYTFKIFANTDLQVIIRSSTGTETVKTLTTHYTVSGVGDASGGNVTFIDGTKIETGDFRLSGNTIETLTQNSSLNEKDFVPSEIA